ncbi:MAG: hypothetical protein LRY67_01395 [Gammaproteobacteria bacterium]|nr:hypothetical protein [Gammaproteobacteria bacterium]MCD8542919.1 hypothetical protein [Gammaproteobacteria bacterium]MCD8573626.1 hypothetical protein [Gammaproteobacteria bacterium]
MKYLKKTTIACIASFGLIALTGCSSIFGDNNRVVHIDSEPKGAKVTVNNIAVDSHTPTEVVVKDMFSPTVITVQKPGCTKKTVIIQPEFQKVGILNILILPGFIVDAITGNMMKVPEDKRHIDVKTC